MKHLKPGSPVHTLYCKAEEIAMGMNELLRLFKDVDEEYPAGVIQAAFKYHAVDLGAMKHAANFDAIADVLHELRGTSTAEREADWFACGTGARA
jgi:hypothetical protein